MPHRQPNLFLRNDTMLGVCQGLGEEFGFNPLWLRLALASALLWNPPVVIASYLALAVAFAVARWLYPVPQTASTVPQLATDSTPADASPAEVGADAEVERLAA